MVYNSISLIFIFTLFTVIAIKRNRDKIYMVEDFLWMVMLFAVIRTTAYILLGV